MVSCPAFWRRGGFDRHATTLRRGYTAEDAEEDVRKYMRGYDDHLDTSCNVCVWELDSRGG
jgi:hypothetical protein